MTMFRGGFAKTISPLYRKVLFNTFKEREVEGSKIVNMNTAPARAYIDDFQVAGFGTLMEKAEGGPYAIQDAKEGGSKRYNWTTYGLGFRVTEEMWEDDLYALFGSKMTAALGRSVRNNFELVAHSPFNNAFSTSYSGFTSGEALCGTHTTIRGGSLTNTPTTQADFDLLSFQAALEHFHSLTDESGLPVVYIPKRVIHSIGDHWTVQQILKSDKLPGTNQNDINAVANEGISAHLSHYLDDPDAWFVQCDMHDINYFDRVKPTFRSGDDLNTGDAVFMVRRRNGAGWGDWRGVYGSSGA